MPTMDRRIKGCRNVHCRYNKERKHLPLDYNYCPICEYSRAVTPQIRQAGNRLSGLAETAYVSLLA